MISTSFVIAALFASSSIASPLPLSRSGSIKGVGHSGDSSGLAGSIVQSLLGSGAAIGAQALENANQQEIASQQLAAASSIAAAAAAQATAAPAAKREPVRLPKLSNLAGSGIFGNVLAGGLAATETLGAQAVQDQNQQEIADKQIAAATGAAKREPLKFGGGGAGSGLIGDILQGALGAAATFGAQGLENANQQDIANQQIAAATGAAAKRALSKFGGVGSGLGGSVIQGFISSAAALGAQGLENANNQDIANAQLSAASSIAAAQATAAPVKRTVLEELD